MVTYFSNSFASLVRDTGQESNPGHVSVPVPWSRVARALPTLHDVVENPLQIVRLLRSLPIGRRPLALDVAEHSGDVARRVRDAERRFEQLLDVAGGERPDVVRQLRLGQGVVDQRPTETPMYTAPCFPM